ncbi:MAG: glutaminyl-peptide cyclotransferase [Flavobacteriales bacterium]|nr:glutaminyl-peptide cyclotransferase [Flavobacteriales bacterium]
MKKYNALAFILLGLLLTNCQGTEDAFNINEKKLKAQYSLNESLSIEVLNPNSEKIDSIVYAINDKRVGSQKEGTLFTYELKNEKLGFGEVKTSVYYDGEVEKDSTQIEIVSNVQPKLLSYTIVNTYPHDTSAYTQGLEFYNGVLYEGTGQYGESTLRKTDYKTGKVDVKVDLDARYFGEGITFLNDKIYQLTWQENTAFVYDAKTLKKEKQFSYPQNMEGWGLTNDGKNLYMTDKSERIHILDPNTFKELDYINVYSLKTRIEAVNELEWVDGKIFGNVYQKDAIAVINPKTGAVEGILNLADLETKITKLPDTDVLNGIAYNAATKTFFVTGKNWDKMFEIRINP